MRFNNDDYLAAFPREERPAQAPMQQPQPGSVTEEADNLKQAPKQEPEQEPEPGNDAQDLGGDADGNE